MRTAAYLSANLAYVDKAGLDHLIQAGEQACQVKAGGCREAAEGEVGVPVSNQRMKKSPITTLKSADSLTD